MPQLEFLGHADKVSFADQMSPQLRQFSFVESGKMPEQLLAGDQSENGIAEKLQLLIVTHPWPQTRRLNRFYFPGLRAVRQGLEQKLRTMEMMAKRRLKCANVS